MPVLGAQTVKIVDAKNPCPICMADKGKSKKCSFYVHTDSYGNAEMLIFKCPTHGELKRLYRYPAPPVFQQTYAEALTGKKQKPPKKRKEI